RCSKGGRFPFLQIHEDLRSVLAEHQAWHRAQPSPSPWFFPSDDPDNVLSSANWRMILSRAARQLGLAHRTPHGLRAFYVPLQRSHGLPDHQVAALIGDATTRLISDVY